MTNDQQKQLQNQAVKKFRLTLIFCALLIFSLSISKLVLSNRAATWGEELESIELATETLKKKNQELRLTLSQQSGSLVYLQDHATELGFVNTPEYLYLSPSANVAQKLP